MAEPHVVSALVAKRGGIGGGGTAAAPAVAAAGRAAEHLDAAIRLFAPDHDLSSVRPRQRRVGRQRFGQGECQRLVLETLRDARDPLADRQFTAAMLVRKGVTGECAAGAALQKTTLATLRRLSKKGAIRTLILPDGHRGWAGA